MNTETSRYYPLSPQTHGTSEVGAVLDVLPHQGKLILRGDWTDDAPAHWFRQHLGQNPPKTGEASTITLEGVDIGRVVWQGPDCLWLFLNVDHNADSWKVCLQANTDGAFVSAVGVSDYYVSLRLSGTRAVECLRQGSPFDWRTLDSGKGAVFTMFYKSSVLVEYRAQDEFWITVRASHAPYLWAHLAQAVDSLGVFV